MQSSLLAIPLPLLVAMLCVAFAVLVWRVDLGLRKASQIFSALFAVFAFESLLVGLRFGYGIDRFILLQGALPLVVGPLLYLGFAALAVTPERLKQLSLRHFGMVLVVLFIVLILPLDFVPLDWAISASYLFYAIALFLFWRQGGNALIHARLEMARGLMRLMLWAVGLLMVLFLLDTAIAVSFAMRNEGQAVALISYGTIPLILALILGVLFVPRYLAPRPVQPRHAPEEADEHAELDARARALLIATQLYLDPELTVQRLAKRLHVPARKLSLAINESQGMNVSQYVNGFRLAHAADLLETSDDSVTKVMAQSGFLTRSNFYREFQRVFGKTPAAYRQDKAGQNS